MLRSEQPSASAEGQGLAYFVDLEPSQGDFLADVLAGLAATPKTLAPKYFYDKRGSELFDQICLTPEYYVTRTEIAMLREIGPEVAALTGPRTIVVEYGSGSSWKIRTLLDSLDRPAEYVAIDISNDHLRHAALAIAGAYPSVRVGAVCADFGTGFTLPNAVGHDGARLGFLPGSTIGNQTPDGARAFLARTRAMLSPGGALLIGVDLRKDPNILDRAYNDAAGHTAAFNTNLLIRMQRELNAQLDPDGFEHHAFFNDAESRVEMHLRARRDQVIRLGEQDFPFRVGETIHTENSYKYTVEGFRTLASEAGFTPRQSWTDPDGLFSLHYLQADARDL